MNNLVKFQEYFRSAAAESDIHLVDVYVENKQYSEIVTPKDCDICVLVGNKGSGKSALLKYINSVSENAGIPSLLVTPSDLDIEDTSGEEPPAKIIKKLRSAILKAMAISAGNTLSGYLDQKKYQLYRDAVDSGVKSEDLVERILGFLGSIGKVKKIIDTDSISKTSNNSDTTRVQSLKSFVADKEVFYILFDDIDQIENATNPNYYNMIWYTILAMFKIAQELQNVYPIITVRKEIWRQLRKNTSGNWDKYDHIRDMVVFLDPDRAELKKIVSNRIDSCVKNNNLHIKGMKNLHLFFDGDDCKLPTSTERRTWLDYLSGSSRENPRDVIQLIHHLVKSAIDSNHKTINDDDVETTAYAYSKERENDLVEQNKDLCKNLDAVVRYFARKKTFSFTAEELLKTLDQASSNCSIFINGRQVHQGIRSDTFFLWDFLFRLSFINPKVYDIKQPKNYRFLMYEDDDNLIQECRWNDLQQTTWEIKQCYRSFLIEESKNSLYI